MAKSKTSLNLDIASQFASNSLHSSLQSLDNTSPNAPLESILHPAIFFGNLHSKQARKSLYPRGQQQSSFTGTKQLITLQQVILYQHRQAIFAKPWNQLFKRLLTCSP